MNSTDDILDISKLCFEGDFDTQVENILYRVRLTASEVQDLRYLFKDLEKALYSFGPGLQVMPFGSIVTGLGIKTSDVDCYVALPDVTEPRNTIVIHARNILRKHYRLFTNLFAITSAKVPIVKFLHIPTNCHCDINFHSPAGVHNSELIAKLLHMDNSQRALHLAILIKYWSKMHKLTGTNLLSSYCLTLMVIFYLQLMNILPPIIEMQASTVPTMVDNWDMSFDKDINSDSDNCDSLYDLMGGFFKCYANLNFEENIVSPFIGRLLPRKLFAKLQDVPEEFEIYKYNVSTNVCKPLKIDTALCIQDPFEHARNSSVAVYQKLAARIKALFQYAAKKFDEVPPKDFLEALFKEGPPSIAQNLKQKPKHRPHIKPHMFHNKIMKPKVNPHQRKRGLLNKANLIKCYKQIKGAQKQTQ